MIQFALENPVITALIVLIVFGFLHDMSGQWADAFKNRKER